MKTQAVIGLGFGDEGKGSTVDYLCSLSPDALVVRFNGGHQAGHTVVKDGIRHVFSNFGSGTLRGCPTYWSKYCTVEPIGLMNELEDLLNKGINPMLYIDAECPVTTQYDIKQNRRIEKNNEHGSCGVGFGATIEREESFYSLRFIDLYYYQIFRRKLDLICHHYYNRHINDDLVVDAVQQLIKNKHIKMVFKRPSADQYIYEGAQGLMLDQHYGFFPHVTRSNCGSKNIPDDDVEFFLVTRAYQTRHGNGPMTTNHLPHTIISDKNETNCTHRYQGEFRRGLLDVDLLKYAINKDKRIRESSKQLVVTCLDHLTEYKFVRNGKVIKCSTKEEFLTRISLNTEISIVNYSDSYESKTMKLLDS